MRAILSSTVVGFLCVIAAYVSPDTVFLFLLNSSGAIILFVYLLIAVSQVVLRRRTPDGPAHGEDVAVPGAVDPAHDRGILAILVQMGVDSDTRSQLLLSLLAWAVILVALLRSPDARPAPPRRRTPSPRGRRTGCWCWPTRP